MASHYKWMKLSLPTETHHIISMNPNEFLLRSKHAYKYNSRLDTFETFHTLPERITKHSFSNNHVAFNKINKIIYYYDEHNVQCINLITRQQNEYDVNIPYGMYLLFVNNNLHIIKCNNAQWIGSIQNNTLNVIHNTVSNRHRRDGKAMYISSKHCILLIGGYFGIRDITDIWIYSLLSEKWLKLNTSFDGYRFGAVLTSNQRYVVLMGGLKGFSEKISDIYVLDMKDNDPLNWKIRKSTILCPYSGDCCITRTGGIDAKNEILIIGYIKQCFKMQIFEHLHLPPMYLMMIIVKYFSAEMIHWIHGINHYAIYLKNIIPSLI